MYYLLIIIVLICVSIFFLFFYKKPQPKKEPFKTTDYLDGIDVIYWINLDRSVDRRQRMEKMFEDPVFAQKKIIRISAVDGKAHNIDQILNVNFEGMQPDKFSKVEYACTLSHINTLREFSKSNDEVALVMEDDMTLEFKPYWKKSVKQIMDNAPSDWEIIQLCYILQGNNLNLPKKIYTKNNNRYFSTGAYIINKKNNNIPKIIHSSNPTADLYLYNIFNTYVYKYPMFIYSNDEVSTIHQDHINHHNKSKNMLLANLIG